VIYWRFSPWKVNKIIGVIPEDDLPRMAKRVCNVNIVYGNLKLLLEDVFKVSALLTISMTAYSLSWSKFLYLQSAAARQIIKF
jgi:hypothetical protein